MPYTFAFERKHHYLHVKVVTGDNSYLTIRKYLMDVYKLTRVRCAPIAHRSR